MSALIAPLNKKWPDKAELDLLVGDAQLIIGAGRWVMYDCLLADTEDLK